MTSAVNTARLEQRPDGQLWCPAYPDYTIAYPGGEFIDSVGNSTGYYYLQANLFEMNEPTFGAEFWLVRTAEGHYDPNSYETSDPGVAGSVHVPWKHIVQHLYDYFTDLQIKEAHTFWPYGTTEENLLAALVAELNKSGTSGGTLAWKSENEIKTFFPSKPATPTDKYSGDQISDVSSLLS